MSKTITNNEKYQIIGLIEVARKHQAIVTTLEREIRNIWDESDVLLDAIYNPDEDLEESFEAWGVEVSND